MRKVIPVPLKTEKGEWNWKRILKIRQGETFTGITVEGRPFIQSAFIYAGIPLWRIDGKVHGATDMAELRQITEVF